VLTFLRKHPSYTNTNTTKIKTTFDLLKWNALTDEDDMGTGKAALPRSEEMPDSSGEVPAEQKLQPQIERVALNRTLMMISQASGMTSYGDDPHFRGTRSLAPTRQCYCE
jgi:hypothetical protein